MAELFSYGLLLLLLQLLALAECSLASTRTTCKPAATPLSTFMHNGGFQEIYFDDFGNTTRPTWWDTTYDDRDLGFRSRSRPNENRFGVAATHGTNLTFMTTNIDFNRDPCDPGRFYNLTFDFAVVKYLVPTGSRYKSCFMTLGDEVKKPPLRLSDQRYAAPWKTLGPYTFDMANQTTTKFSVYCTPQQPVGSEYAPRVNITLWIDNVSWSQNGHVVAGARAGKPAP